MTDATVHAPASGRQWTILRRHLSSDVLSLPVLWALYVLAVAVMVGAVAVFRADGIETSGIELTVQVTRWFLVVMGIYQTAVYLPLYIAHGLTRREFAMQLPFAILAMVAMYAALMAAAFAIEALAYRAFDWPQALMDDHLFATPMQYPLVFTEFFVTGMVWMVAGAMLGAAFYRNGLLGVVLVPVGLLMALTVEGTAGTPTFGAIPGNLASVPGLPSPGLAAALGTAGVLFIAGMGITWLIIRNLPIRAKSS